MRGTSIGTAAAVLLLAASSVRAQVVTNPNQIVGTVGFTNTNPAVLDLLNVAGITRHGIGAISLPPAPASFHDADGSGAAYQMSVETSPAGTVYDLQATAYIGQESVYKFAGIQSRPPPPLATRGESQSTGLSLSMPPVASE